MRKLLTFLIALASIIFAVCSPVSAQGFNGGCFNCGCPACISGGSYTGPGDINGATTAFWGGLRGFSAAYAAPGTGCAIDIEDQAGGNLLTCVVIKSNGDLDTATVSTWVTAHSVTTIKIPKLYDQSGNGNHATQATLANMPELVQSGLGSKPVIRVNGSEQFNTPSFGSLVNTSTVSLVWQANGTSSFGRVYISGTFWALISDFSGSNNVALYNGNQLLVTVADNAAHTGQIYVDSVAGAAGYIDGTNNGPQANLSSQSSAPYSIGGNASQNLAGFITEWGIWYADKRANNSAMCHNQFSYWGTSVSC